MKMSNIFPIIMAGGKGERFWPKSRKATPKQLLSLIDDTTMIEQTVARQLDLAPRENIFVITNLEYKKVMDELLPIPNENIIGEPMGRDTAPCVALAMALIASKKLKNSIMLLLPADHIIHNKLAYTNTIGDAVRCAEKYKSIITIGIKPLFPSTAYGYIHSGEKVELPTQTLFFKSKGFKEKPDEEKAKTFFENQSYFWNAGMFVWTLDTITDAFSKYAPSLLKMSNNLQIHVNKKTFSEVLKDEYLKQEKLSIDYAIMEKANNVIVATCGFDWDDIGSWTAIENHLAQDSNKNTIKGACTSYNSKNNIVITDNNHLIGLVDIENTVVVHTNDATLVCNKNSAQKVKLLLKLMYESEKLSKFT